MILDVEVVNQFTDVIKKLYEETKYIKDINIENKIRNDIVTDVDLFMENKIIEVIHDWYPTHSIYAEESGDHSVVSEYQWIIDPIDGTVNFAAGLPLFSTSIALKKNNEVIFGIVFDFSNDDVYFAIKGRGAYCNGTSISVSTRDTLSHSIVSISLGADYDMKYIKEVLDIEKNLAIRVRGLRVICSSAIELCWLASGKIDGFIKVKPSKGIGSTAGKLIVEEAGGKVTNLVGKYPDDIDTLFASNSFIHEEITTIINK